MDRYIYSVRGIRTACAYAAWQNTEREGARFMLNPTSGPARWNILALVSALLALLFPAGLVLLLLGGGIYQTVDAFTPRVYLLGVVLLVAGMPATLPAIVTGHLALRWAKRRAYERALRGSAILGLALGYGALVLYLGWFVLGWWAMTHLRLRFTY